MLEYIGHLSLSVWRLMSAAWNYQKRLGQV